jgi:hypothetical protein
MKDLVLPADGTLAARRNARTFGTAQRSTFIKLPQSATVRREGARTDYDSLWPTSADLRGAQVGRHSRF